MGSRRTVFFRLSFAAFAAIGLGGFLSGVLLGNLLHLAACPLCILQRMLYLLLGTLALVGVFFAGKPLVSCLLTLLLMLAAGTGGVVAAYQSWIQLHPEGPSCTADSPWWERFVYWAGEQAPDLFLSSGMCTDPGFTLFGLSIANYSLLLFAVLFLAAVGILFQRRARTTFLR